MARRLDWESVKTEYVTSNISYRDLAKKHNVSFNTLKCNATKGKWHDARQQYRNEVNTKIVEKAERTATSYKNVLYDLANKVAKQLADMVDAHDMEEFIAIGVKPRDITGAIKDLKDALNVRSDADLREQEARIAKMEKEIESGNESNDIRIIFDGDIEELSK